MATGYEGVARGLAFAWERQMWIPTIGVLVHYIGEHIPAEFIKDRKEGYLGIDISKAAMAPQWQEHVQFVRAQIAWLKQALNNKSYLFGDKPSVADLACWQTLFLLRKNCPAEVDTLLGLEPLTAWYDRILAHGHGTSQTMTPEEAFQTACRLSPSSVTYLNGNTDPAGLTAGTKVRITPDDNARVPVTGTLIAANAFEVVIHRHDEQAGDLHVHFPRMGYTVEAI
jgi:glutathione S-transferase